MKRLFLLLLFAAFSGCAELPEIPTEDDLSFRWMDRKIYFAQSSGLYSQRNNEFQKQKIKEALSEIAESSNLGSNYFEFYDVEEGLLSPIIQQTISEDEFKSFVLILPDEDFSDFVFNQLGGISPDPNAVSVINSAYKRKFFVIFKASCLSAGVNCDSITGSLGLRALVARQLGLLVGLSEKDCSIYPNDVMCATKAKDSQWMPSNRDPWISIFNNQLESIRLSPGFYDENFPGQ